MTAILESTNQGKKPDEVEYPRDWPIACAAEKSLLGAMIEGRATEACQIFSAGDFGLSAHREIFLAIKALVEREPPATPVVDRIFHDRVGGRRAWIEFSAIAAELSRRGSLGQIGGWSYVTDLTSGTCASWPLSERWDTLNEFSARRVGILFAAELERRFRDPTVSIKETLSWLESQVAR